MITGFDFINLVRDGERVFVTYEGQSKSGRPFRNTEILTVKDGKIAEGPSHFGWSIRTTLRREDLSILERR